jgi:hypothetical protein
LKPDQTPQEKLSNLLYIILGKESPTLPALPKKPELHFVAVVLRALVIITHSPDAHLHEFEFDAIVAHFLHIAHSAGRYLECTSRSVH